VISKVNVVQDQINQMIRDIKTLEYNKTRLEKYINDEINFAQRQNRFEGLIYVFAMKQNMEISCNECSNLLEGKYFLLYDGRTQKRFQLPTIPNPLCQKIYDEFDFEKECCYHWMKVRPEMQYLKKEKRFSRSCNEYIEIWNVLHRGSNEQEWKEWISQNPYIEIYVPPLIWSSVKLNTLESSHLHLGHIKVYFDELDLSLRDVGLIWLIGIMASVSVAGTSFGRQISDYSIDFSKPYNNLELGGKNYLADLIKKIKYQDSGGILSENINGYIKSNSSFLEVHVTFGFNKDTIDQILHLSKADIQLISKGGWSALPNLFK
jgi:hypothetical protein